MNLKKSLLKVFGHSELFGVNSICPCKCEFELDNIIDKPFLIITGENASGKSFLCKILDSFLRSTKNGEENILPMLIGMNKRSASGIVRAMMFGSEEDQSTGEISINVIKGALNSSKKNDDKHLIMLDEPDIGLSEAYIPGLAHLLSEYYQNMSDSMQGFVLVTHNRVLVKHLMHLNSDTIRFGSEQTTQDWIENGPESKTLEELYELGKTSTTRYSRIHQYLKNQKKSKMFS